MADYDFHIQCAVSPFLALDQERIPYLFETFPANTLPYPYRCGVAPDLKVFFFNNLLVHLPRFDVE